MSTDSTTNIFWGNSVSLIKIGRRAEHFHFLQLNSLFESTSFEKNGYEKEQKETP